MQGSRLPFTIAGAVDGYVDVRCLRMGLSTHRSRIMSSGPTVVARTTTVVLRKIPQTSTNHGAWDRLGTRFRVLLHSDGYSAFPLRITRAVRVYQVVDNAEDRNPAVIVLQNAGGRDG